MTASTMTGPHAVDSAARRERPSTTHLAGVAGTVPFPWPSASANRSSPATIIGFAASAPPDGLIELNARRTS